MGKFTKQAAKINLDLSHLMNRAIKRALIAAITTATQETVHDSSNAAVHWMLAAQDGKVSKPWARKTGTLRDLRGTIGRKGVRPARKPQLPVGYRGDGGENQGMAVKYVSLRERTQVIDMLVAGRHSITGFRLYHPLLEERFAEPYTLENIKKYRRNAGIVLAGKAAVEAAREAAYAAVMAGLGRKRRV